MNTAIEHRNLWFWRIQHPDVKMSTRNFMLKHTDATPPRWMIQEWLTVASEDGQDTEKVVPVKKRNSLDFGVWPKEETTNAIYHLDLARSRRIND